MFGTGQQLLGSPCASTSFILLGGLAFSDTQSIRQGEEAACGAPAPCGRSNHREKVKLHLLGLLREGKALHESGVHLGSNWPQ